MFVTFKKVKKEKTESLLINFPFTNQMLGILFVPCSAESIFVCTCFRSLSFSTLTHFDDFAELKLPATIPGKNKNCRNLWSRAITKQRLYLFDQAPAPTTFKNFYEITKPKLISK